MKGKIDIHNYENKLKTTIKKIQNSDKISAFNKKVLQKYYQTLCSENLSYARIEKIMDTMGRIAETLKKDLNKVTEEDLRAYITTILTNSKYSPWTKQNYKVNIKRFWKWYEGNNEDYPQKVKWIKTGIPAQNIKLPEQLLTENDVLKLIDACENARDRAIISTLYETGCRIGELGSATISSVSFENGSGQLTLMGKTGARKVFIHFSIPFLREWLKDRLHAKPSDPLFITISGRKGKPLCYNAYRKILAYASNKANLGKPINPHHFRHSRATFLANHLTESQLDSVMGWRIGSDMARTYVHLSGRQINGALKKIYGLGEQEKTQESILKPVKCTICGEINEPGVTECKKCFNPLTIKAAVERFSEQKKALTILDKATTEELKTLIESVVERVLEKKTTENLLHEVVR
jgi:integrase